MKTNLECISCFIRQSLEAARMVTDNNHIHEEIIKEVMKYLQSISFKSSPPEISREVHNIIRNKSHSSDPYKNVKDQSNIMAEKLYPYLKKSVNKSNDPLLMSIKLAIVGNVIDFGTSNRFNVEDILDEAIHQEFNDDTYPRFKKSLTQAKTILYLADNTGEIFFDKPLIEEFVKRKKEITYVVKANPIINDATIEDAKFAGIDKLARVLEGDKGRDMSSPGILLKYASNEFLDLFDTADIVVSKGQGNYESLNESSREVFFLLMVKCPLIAKDMETELARLVFEVKG